MKEIKTNKASNSKKSLLIKFIIIIIVVALITAFISYGNNHIVITEYEYKNSLIPDEMNGLCVVQLSDLHNASFGADNTRLIDNIKKCNPDIIIITGDLVDGVTHTNIPKAINLVKQLTNICDVYYITGNHEYYLNDDKRKELIDALTDEGVTVLSDSCIQLADGFNLIGLDDNNLNSDILGTMTNADTFDLVLAHEPQRIKKYAGNGADLVLSGHAHGGQFRLPFIGAVYAPDQGLNPEYTEGLINYNDTDMIISRGLGNSVFPFRIFNDPEIVCVKFSN